MSRVLVVTNDFPTRRGGIESFVLALCERMPPEDVVVYTASMPGDKEYDAGLPFPVYRDPSSTLFPTRAVGRRAVKVMQEHDCDRIMFGASAPLGLLAARLRRAGAQRIVALTHGHEVWWAKVPIARQVLRRLGDSVDVLTYVSEWCRSQIAVALTREAEMRMARLSPGVDTDRFYPGCGGDGVRRRFGIPRSAPVAVCTARMVKRKGQETLVRAWPFVVQAVPDARLLLVGDGPNLACVEALTHALGLDGSVLFARGGSWDEMPAFTDAGDVFAMPCRTRRLGLEPEAFGIVTIEAAACGLPVIIGNSGGAPETVREGVTGWVCDSTDPSEWGRLIVDLFTDSVAGLAMGEAGRRQAIASWSWTQASDRLRQLLF